MIDTQPVIVQALSATGLKVYFEHFVNSETPLPCITYTEYDNSADKQGDTLGYSNITYHIKVWANNKTDISKYSKIVDEIMRQNGFTRTNTVELWLDNVGQLQLKYRCLAKEYF